MKESTLYYGDNLDILKNHIPDDSVDLIYLDPPFNSKADYNVLFQEPTGTPSSSQITAFEDSWHWTNETQTTFQTILDTASASIVEMMASFKKFIGPNDMMAYLTMMCIRLIELKRVLKDTGSIYLHCDPTASHYLKILLDTIFGKSNFKNEIIWYYNRWSAATNRFQRIHDVILFYSKTKKPVFNMLYDDYTAGTLKRWKGIKRKTTILDDGSLYQEEDTKGVKGANMGDVWRISIINANAKERLGYPTQKPEELLERVIKASSNEGGIVLDPFCGCGTTISVAQEFKRKWIGIDVTHLAINLIKKRLKDRFSLKAKRDYKVVGEPEDLEGAKELALHNRYQFQWWALSLVNARPYKDKKKGADTGIDGYIYLHSEEDILKKAIVQVKSGHVSVKDIRDLGHVADREEADIGVFITLNQPTKQMVKEATIKGNCKFLYWNIEYPKLQILTIEELLKGTVPKLPPEKFEFYKKAKKVKGKNLGLFPEFE
jgi:DNA modification methylase